MVPVAVTVTLPGPSTILPFVTMFTLPALFSTMSPEAPVSWTPSVPAMLSVIGVVTPLSMKMPPMLVSAPRVLTWVWSGLELVPMPVAADKRQRRYRNGVGTGGLGDGRRR